MFKKLLSSIILISSCTVLPIYASDIAITNNTNTQLSFTVHFMQNTACTTIFGVAPLPIGTSKLDYETVVRMGGFPRSSGTWDFRAYLYASPNCSGQKIAAINFNVDYKWKSVFAYPIYIYPSDKYQVVPFPNITVNEL